MGYFSNGTEGDIYEARYCARCVHEDHKKGCAVMLAHALHNYEACNDDDHVLHLLIPRGPKGENLQCAMFYPRGGKPTGGGERLEKAA